MKYLARFFVCFFSLLIPLVTYPQVISLDVGCSSSCLGPTKSPSISGNGSRIAFVTRKQLSTNDVFSNTRDVYVWDKDVGFILITARPVGFGDYNAPSISEDGRYVTYASSFNHVSADTNGKYDIYRYDIDTQVTELVSVSSSGEQGNRDSGVVFTGNLSVPPALSSAGGTNSAISTSGRFIAFQSYSTNLVNGDTSNNSDIFVRDMVAGTTEKVSLRFNGLQTVSKSRHPSISPNGRYVAFETNSSLEFQNGILNLNWFEPHIYDRQTDQIRVLGERSSTPNTSPLQNYSGFSLTDSKIFYHARNDDSGNAGSTTRIYERILPVSGNGSVLVQASPAYSTSVSDDERFLLYFSDANLDPEVSSGGKVQLYIHDLMSDDIKMLSVSESGVAGNNDSGSQLNAPDISANSRKIVFYSQASNLVANGGNASDLFVVDNPFPVEAVPDSAGYYNNLYLSYGLGFNPEISITTVAEGRYLGHSNNTQRLHVADFNGDGLTDLLNASDTLGGYYNNLYLSNGQGFDPAISIALAGGKRLGHSNNTQRLHVADFNGDGKADLLNVGNVHGAGGGYHNLYLSNGQGFDPTISITTVAEGRYLGHSNNTQRLHVADFNGDGKADLLNASDTLGGYYNNLYLSNGQGFDPAISIAIAGGKRLGHSNNTQRLHVADFNGDGKADLLNVGNVYGAGGGYHNLYLSNGLGFDSAVSITTVAEGRYLGHSNNTQRLHVADFNGDGKADLLNASDTLGGYYNNLYLSNGQGFDPAISIAIAGGKRLGHSNNTQRLHVADFNGDGKADLLNVGNVYGAGGGYHNLYLSNGLGFDSAVSITTVAEGRYLGHSNNTQRLHIADFNGDGLTDLLNTGNVAGDGGF